MKCVELCLFVLLLKGIHCQISYEKILGNSATNELLSAQCRKDVELLGTSPLTYWQMVDASSNIPSGLSRGNFFPMGNHDQCLDIKEVETKFCPGTVTLNPGSNFQTKKLEAVTLQDINLGISFYYCVLKSCSADDLNLMFNGLVHFKDECSTKDSKLGSDALAIAAIVIFSIIGVITVVSTVYDIYLFYKNTDSPHPILIAFSLYSNGRKLFRLGESQHLQSLNGIKSLSMLWVVLGHVYMAYVFVPLDNYLDVYNWVDSTYSQYISGATVTVDSFFVIGGFLTIYTFQAAMDKTGRFNVPLYYFHRILRLTPALAAMVLAHAALFNYLGSGPVWTLTDTYLSKACKEYYWSALLYVQNYANPNGICVPQSWYLSVDMQLFIVSPILLVLMRQWPLWGYISISFVSVVSIIASFLIGWFYKLGGQMTANTNGNLTDYMKYYYMPTHTRMVPYLFGIMLGYYIYEMKKSKREVKLNTIFVLFGWVFCMGVLAACLFGGHTLQLTEYDRAANSFYIALMRPSWALGVCWVIFACVMGFGGPIDWFLSLPLFQILSRLCYSIYLVHYSFIFLTNFHIRSPLHFSDYNAFHKFCGDLAFSTVIAIIWTLVFESPVIVLEKVLLSKGRGTGRESKTPLV